MPGCLVPASGPGVFREKPLSRRARAEGNGDVSGFCFWQGERVGFARVRLIDGSVGCLRICSDVNPD